MKKTISILLAIALLLSGCSLTVGPASTPTQISATEASGETEVTDVTEVTNTVIDLNDWSNDTVLFILPSMDTDVEWSLVNSSDSGVSISTLSLSVEDAKSYAQALIDAGFDLDQDFEIYTVTQGNREEEWLCFVARDKDWNTVSLSCTSAKPKNGSAQWETSLSVNVSTVDTTPSATAVKSKVSWESNSIQNNVPAPPTEYWSPYPNRSPYTVKLEYLDIEQVREYADQLRDAGFTYYQYESLGLIGQQYVFSAGNEAGYSVSIRHTLWTGESMPDVTLQIMLPGDDSVIGWDSVMPKYLPNPEDAIVEWSLSALNEDKTIHLYGMSYQGAQAYVEQIEQATQAYGWEFELCDTSEQDDANEYLNCQMLLREPLKNDVAQYQLHYWTLIYDPSNAECPCILVNN